MADHYTSIDNQSNVFYKKNYELIVNINGDIFINGINNKDDVGKFNPKDDITPAESALITSKLIALVINSMTSPINIDEFVDYLIENNLLKHFDKK